jgi:transcription elongation factor Elf1
MNDTEENTCPDCGKQNAVRLANLSAYKFRLECKLCGWWFEIYTDIFGGLHVSTKEHPDGAIYW